MFTLFYDNVLVIVCILVFNKVLSLIIDVFSLMNHINLSVKLQTNVLQQ